MDQPQPTPAVSEPAETSPGVEIGHALAQAREAQELTLDDVANQIKFSTRQIEALEAGHFAQLPGGPFVRGMVRSYARLLNMDPGPLLLRMQVPAEAADPSRIIARLNQPVPFADASKRSNLVYAALSVVVLGVAVLVAWQWRRAPPPVPEVKPAPVAQVRDEPDQQLRLLLDAEAPAPAPAPGAARPASKPPAAAIAPKPPAAAIASKPETAPVAPAKAEARVPAKVAPALKAPSAVAVEPGRHRIVVRAAEEAWVEVTDATNHVLIAQLLPGGSQRTLDGEPPFALVIGNAQFVQITLDGKSVDLKPHIKVEVARFRLQ